MDKEEELGAEMKEPLKTETSSSSEDEHENPVMMSRYGTIGVVFIYKGGIVLCADNLNMVEKKSTVMPVGDHIMVIVEGCAADCCYWVRNLCYENRCHNIEYGKPLPIHSAAIIIRKAATDEMKSGRSLGITMILAGTGHLGPVLYRVTSDGSYTKHTNFAVVGGQSLKVTEILDNRYHYNLTDAQARDLGFSAAYHGTLVDPKIDISFTLHLMATIEWETLEAIDYNQLHANYTRNLNYAGEEVIDDESSATPSKQIKLS